VILALADRGISPDAVDALDISVIAALLGIDKVSADFDRAWDRMRAARVEAAREGKPMPTWEEVTTNGRG